MPAQTGSRGPPDLTPREARDRYLNKRRAELRDSSISTLHYRLKLFVEWCEDEGIDSIRDLTGWDLESYEAHRRGEGVKLYTISKELNTLKNFLAYCERAELVEADLADKVEIPDVPKQQRSSDVRLSTAAAEKLLTYYRESSASGTRAHLLLELAWNTGARLGGMRGLDTRDYHTDVEDPYVEFHHRPNSDTPLKNGVDGERAVGLPQEAADALDEYVRKYREDQRDDYGRKPLLTSQRGRPSKTTIRDWMYLGTVPCHHGPCPHEKDPDTCEWKNWHRASQCPSSRSPHQVRTGAITWMRDCEMPIDAVAERVNASPAVIEEHYDKGDPVGEMRERRLPYLDRLGFDSNSDETDSDSDQTDE